MSQAKKRNVHGEDFKAKMGLEAPRGLQAVNQTSQTHAVHPIQVVQWKNVIV